MRCTRIARRRRSCGTPGSMNAPTRRTMASPIEDYGFISNCSGSALVSKYGSIDWLCFPRFDSDACMAALLGRDDHGRWAFEPLVNIRCVSRRYRPGTLILETDFECDGGVVRLTDFMVLEKHSVIRVIQGIEGEVPISMSLKVRFGFGHYKPWVTRPDGDIELTVAPDSLVLRSNAKLEFDERDVTGIVNVRKGDTVTFELTWHPSR